MPRYRWIVFFASFYVFVSYAFILQAVPPLMRPMIHEFNISHAQAGLLMSMAVIPGIFLAIPSGLLVDRYGVKPLGFLSTVLMTVGCFITAVADSFGMALAGRLILGVGGAFMVTAMPTIIPQWFPPRELGKAMGIYGINVPLATVIAFPLSSALMISFGWRYPFYLGTLLAFASIAIFTPTFREGPLGGQGHEQGSRVSKALGNIEVWKVGVLWLLFNAAALSFTTWSPKLFEDFKGMSPVYASSLASALMLGAIPFVPTFGWVSDKIGRRKPLMVGGSALMAAALMAIAHTSDAPLTASVVALGVSAAMVPPMVMALPPEILGPPLAGAGFGVIAVCLNTGIALAPPLIGLIVDATGSPTLSFTAMAAFSALGAVTAYTLRTR